PLRLCSLMFFELDRFQVSRTSRGILHQCFVGLAQVVVSLDTGGVQLYRFFKVPQCIRQVVPHEMDSTQVVVGLSILGYQFHGALELSFREVSSSEHKLVKSSHFVRGCMLWISFCQG